ncbi:uncharacterized protein LOC141959941 [Athene noctua]|uniref:uncharacterized protein LOC141959941 n=1 Tax=Athene noctua TaxID=126797 RepID=UPI003EB7F979
MRAAPPSPGHSRAAPAWCRRRRRLRSGGLGVQRGGERVRAEPAGRFRWVLSNNTDGVGAPPAAAAGRRRAGSRPRRLRLRKRRRSPSRAPPPSSEPGPRVGARGAGVRCATPLPGTDRARSGPSLNPPTARAPAAAISRPFEQSGRPVRDRQHPGDLGNGGTTPPTPPRGRDRDRSRPGAGGTTETYFLWHSLQTVEALPEISNEKSSPPVHT